MHPKLPGNAPQGAGHHEIAAPRPLYVFEPEADSGEKMPQKRWWCAHFAKLLLDNNADSRAETLERKLTEQMQQMQQHKSKSSNRRWGQR
jgi:hypothetical protein